MRMSTSSSSKSLLLLLVLLSCNIPNSNAFLSPTIPSSFRTSIQASTQQDIETERQKAKQSLLGLIGTPSKTYIDPILACPESKEPLQISSSSPILSGVSGTSTASVKLTLKTDEKKYTGRTNTYIDLLQPSAEKEEQESSEERVRSALDSLRVLIPPPIRTILPNSNYIPMRDLFTSPSVSFAYERGWRQGFAAAGFPGVDKEFEMVTEYFRPSVVGAGKTTVVDMSCATGLMTRRLAKSGEYDRVIGCDYSESMLQEARRRIKSDSSLPAIELVRCDVAKIPMQSGKVDALHAGAAMHCWPEVEDGLKEIHRVLKKGGRYFATTFLSDYFSVVRSTENAPSVYDQAFNYFESTDQLKNMLLNAGFEEDKVNVELLGRACVVLRAEK